MHMCILNHRYNSESFKRNIQVLKLSIASEFKLCKIIFWVNARVITCGQADSEVTGCSIYNIDLMINITLNPKLSNGCNGRLLIEFLKNTCSLFVSWCICSLCLYLIEK